MDLTEKTMDLNTLLSIEGLRIQTGMSVEAPMLESSKMNLTSLMLAHGCKVFAEILLTSPTEKTFEDNADGGLTIFCLGDDAMKNFLPKFKNLTAHGKQSLLEYHGVPVYQSMASLKLNDGVMNTLATGLTGCICYKIQKSLCIVIFANYRCIIYIAYYVCHVA